MNFENKLVAILNKDLESGVALNAAAHMCVGLGADLGEDILQLDHYNDIDNNIYPNISKIPFIILRGKSNEIKKIVHSSRELKIEHGVFLNTMTGGTYVEQLARTAQTVENELVFYGCVLCGPWEVVSELTKKFSLWK